jgi:hypothetical protein
MNDSISILWDPLKSNKTSVKTGEYCVDTCLAFDLII